MDEYIKFDDAIKAMDELEQEDIEAYGCKIPEGFDGERARLALCLLPRWKETTQTWRPNPREIDEKIKERRKKHVEALQEMREIMLDDENWENMTRLIEAVTAGGMALQRLNKEDFGEETQ